MPDNMQLRMDSIEPRWQMPPGNEVYFPHPRRILFHAPEPVSQIAPIPVTLFRVVYIRILPAARRLKLTFFLLPCLVAAVNPCYDKVNFIFRHIPNLSSIMI